MYRIRIRGILLFVAFAILAVSGPAIAAPQINTQTHFASYVLTAGPQPVSQRSMGVQAEGSQSLRPVDRFGPWLLELARQGHIQNIRLRADGTLSLLADQQAVDRWQAEGAVA